MIRIWHILPLFSATTTFSASLTAAKIAGGGTKNYVIGGVLGLVLGVISAVLAWMIGRFVQTRDRDPTAGATHAAVFAGQAIFFGWLALSVTLAVLIVKKVLSVS